VTAQDRYRAYAAAQGLDADTMVAADRLLWPGGLMAGFILWLSARGSEFRAAQNMPADARLSDADQAAYTEWLLGEATS
jgi:hypothetical protein